LSITRLESCTNDVVQGKPLPRAATPAHSRRSRGAWDVALGVFAAGYLALVLFDGVDSPLLSLTLILVVAYELIQPRLPNH
jgi:hypothetical protein